MRWLNINPKPLKAIQWTILTFQYPGVEESVVLDWSDTNPMQTHTYKLEITIEVLHIYWNEAMFSTAEGKMVMRGNQSVTCLV